MSDDGTRAARWSKAWRSSALLRAEAMVMLIAAHLAVHGVPFRLTAKFMGRLRGSPERTSDPWACEAARRIGLVVEGMAGRLPMKPKCLAQAIAAKRMLQRRGIPGTIYLGLRRTGAPVDKPLSERPIVAHAWLTVNDTLITGGDNNNCSVINWFT